MKMIVAIIKPFKLDDVHEALAKCGVAGMTVTEVRGYGRQKGQAEIYRGTELKATFLPKLKLEIAVTNEQADSCVKAIQDSASTGRIGDGKVFIFDMEEVIRIRTGEVSEEAI